VWITHKFSFGVNAPEFDLGIARVAYDTDVHPVVVVAGGNHLEFWDVSDPVLPVRLSRYTLAGNCLATVYDGNGILYASWAPWVLKLSM